MGPPPAPGGEHCGRVLAIDDEPQVLAAVVRVVRSAGFEAVGVGDPREALELVEQGHFDAVVSDIRMPGMSGLELLREIRRHDLDVPVVFVTAVPSMDAAVEAIRYGALDFLTKPFDHDQLRQTVEKAVRLARLAAIRRRAVEAQGLSAGVVFDLAATAARFDDTLAGLWMAYQPIVRAADSSLFAYEALMRSRDELLSHPGLVLAAAEQLDRLFEVGRLVRRSVAATVAENPVEAFVNLHPRDLADPDLVDPESELARVAPRIVLEVTERASIGDEPAGRETVAALRRLGFRIAVDDLGAGYASLSSFALLEPEVVKVDISLVRGVDSSPVKRRLVRSIVELCREMGVLVVAEGVETEAERAAVVELGCDLLQGYLLARPGPPFPSVAR